MHTTWSIPDAYLPAAGDGPPFGHEAVCILNASGHDAHLRLDLYFEDRPPVLGIAVVVPSQRSRHLRLDDVAALGGVTVPRETPYGIRVASNVPVAVQYSRLDVTQPNYSLMTTMALAED